MHDTQAPEPLAHAPSLDREGLCAYLATQPDVVAAYLFGSLARGEATSRSDVDIAILFVDDSSSARSVLQRQLELGGALERFANRPVDVVVLNAAPHLLVHQVLRYGRLLYEGDRSARIAFEVRAGKIHADLQRMDDFFTRAMIQETKEVGFGGRRRHRVRAPEAPAR